MRAAHHRRSSTDAWARGRTVKRIMQVRRLIEELVGLEQQRAQVEHRLAKLLA